MVFEFGKIKQSVSICFLIGILAIANCRQSKPVDTVPTFNSCNKSAGSPDIIHDRTPGRHPEKVRYKVIGGEMKGMESSMKLVALGATQRKG